MKDLNCFSNIIIVCGGNMDNILSISRRELYAYARSLWGYSYSPEYETKYIKSLDISHSTSIILAPSWHYDIKLGYSKLKCTYMLHAGLMSLTVYKFTFCYDINSVKKENKIVKDFLEIDKEWKKLCNIKDDILYKKYLTRFIKKFQIENDF